MFKIKPIIKQGKAIVEANMLPAYQASLFNNWLNPQKKGKNLNGELNYELYEFWFENIFQSMLINDFDN
jgi:hypothetical protein